MVILLLVSIWILAKLLIRLITTSYSEKLEWYGIRGIALDWFKSYLTGRTQFVTYYGVSSTPQTIKCGVPQGSILGPLLFLIYINDLANTCKTSLPILFADDTNIFTSGKNQHELESNINDELCRISARLKVNKLSLNIKKTHYMIFTTKNCIHVQFHELLMGIPSLKFQRQNSLQLSLIIN